MSGILAPRVRLWAPILSACALLVAYWIVAAVVVAIDAYDMYPWGRHPSVDSAQFHLGQYETRLISIAARDPAPDVVSIGSSPAKVHSAEDIVAAVPGARRALNLAYGSARPMDRHLVLRQFVRHSSAKHLLIWFDYIYALPAAELAPAFPAYMYDDDPLNDLRTVSLDSLQSTWEMLVKGGPSLRRVRSITRRYKAMYERFQSRPNRDWLAAVVEENRATVDRPTPRGCDQFDAIRTQALPDLRALTSRGTKVDLIIPPYALVFYYPGTYARPTLDEHLVMRQCLVEATARIRGARVVALDKDLSVISNLANYRDEGHLYDPLVANRVLKRLADPDYELTPANITDYVETLRSAVKNYRVTTVNRSEDARLTRPHPAAF